jgi:hypothetical protein
MGDDQLFNIVYKNACFFSNGFDGLDDVHSVGDGTEDAMLAVQPGGLYGAQEKLGTVGVGTGVSHGEDTRASVLESEVLVGKFLAVDGLATGAVAAGEVTTLAHEIVNDTMERRALEVQRLAGLPLTLFAGAEGAEIFRGLGRDVVEQAEGNSTGGLIANHHVKKDLGTLGRVHAHDRAEEHDEIWFDVYCNLTASVDL